MFYKVLPRGASKGSGVAKYLEIIGMNYSDILAIGDGENDRQMLEQAGVQLSNL